MGRESWGQRQVTGMGKPWELQASPVEVLPLMATNKSALPQTPREPLGTLPSQAAWNRVSLLQLVMTRMIP